MVGKGKRVANFFAAVGLTNGQKSNLSFKPPASPTIPPFVLFVPSW